MDFIPLYLTNTSALKQLYQLEPSTADCALVLGGDGCTFSKALSSGIIGPLHGLFESAVRTTSVTEDNMIDCKFDNDVMESLCTEC